MFSSNDLVRKKQNPGVHGQIIDGPILRPGGNYWRVRQAADGMIESWREKSIEPLPQIEEPTSALRAGRLGNHADFSHYLTFLRLKDPLKDKLKTRPAFRFNSLVSRPFLRRSSGHLAETTWLS